jgi:hypothetical protein
MSAFCLQRAHIHPFPLPYPQRRTQPAELKDIGVYYNAVLAKIPSNHLAMLHGIQAIAANIRLRGPWAEATARRKGDFSQRDKQFSMTTDMEL